MDATNTLMTDQAATTTEGQTTSTTAADTSSTTEAVTQQQATQGTTDSTTTDAGDNQKTEGDQDKSSDKPTGAPEKYEFKIPEGLAFEGEALESFSEFAKDLDMPQEAAQKMLDKLVPTLAKRQTDAIAKVQNEWTETSKSDKEFGGEKLTENLAVAKKALDAFGTPELRKLLNETGLGNNPEIIRAFYRAGKSISEDKFVPSGTGNPKQGNRDPAKSLYPNQQS